MGGESWIAGHLYYHQSFLRAVQGFVRPLAASLVEDGLVDGLFFIRYALGGPHVRLRLRVLSGAEERALAAMRQTARSFLEREPSASSLSEEAIRRSNQAFLANDPGEEDAVYPDNTLRIVPFHPEVERYGGPDRFRASLDFFTLSSVAAVEFLSRHGDAPRSVQLARAFGLLLRQALGFAADEAELSDLLRYGVDSWGESLPKVVEKADAVARSQMDVFLGLFHEPPSSPASDLLTRGAQALSAAIGTDRVLRARIGGSQLHMTANRLGLGNPEELYLSRLWVKTLEQASPRVFARPAEDLGPLLPQALSLLMEGARPPEAG